MWVATQYRQKALEFLEFAQTVDDQRQKGRLLELAQAYARLADLADKNSATDIVYETPPRQYGAAMGPQRVTRPHVEGDPAA